jgi:hypothetical protein
MRAGLSFDGAQNRMLTLLGKVRQIQAPSSADDAEVNVLSKIIQFIMFLSSHPDLGCFCLW